MSDKTTVEEQLVRFKGIIVQLKQGKGLKLDAAHALEYLLKAVKSLTNRIQVLEQENANDRAMSLRYQYQIKDLSTDLASARRSATHAQQVASVVIKDGLK